MSNTDCVNFNNWILNSSHLEKFVYYTGAHMSDTILSIELRKVAWEHACKGKIYLVQRKVRANLFEYIAIKANSPPNIKLVPLSEALDNKKLRSKSPTNHHYLKWQVGEMSNG